MCVHAGVEAWPVRLQETLGVHPVVLVVVVIVQRAEPMDGHRLLCYSGASTQPATPLELSVCLSLSWTMPMLTSAVTSCC
jgi:hypothetical protein